MAGYNELDKLVWEWFTMARAKKMPVSGSKNDSRTISFMHEWIEWMAQSLAETA